MFCVVTVLRDCRGQYVLFFYKRLPPVLALTQCLLFFPLFIFFVLEGGGIYTGVKQEEREVEHLPRLVLR